MPIVTIETLSDDAYSTTDAMPSPAQLQSLANALGELFGSQPAGTWVRVRQQQRAYYAENLVEVSPDMRPVIVEVLKSELDRGRELDLEAAAVCALVAQVLGRRTEHVHVIYELPARGRVAFGGKLVR